MGYDQPQHTENDEHTIGPWARKAFSQKARDAKDNDMGSSGQDGQERGNLDPRAWHWDLSRSQSGKFLFRFPLEALFPDRSRFAGMDGWIDPSNCRW